MLGITRNSVLGIQESDGKVANYVRRNIRGGIGILLILIAATYAASLATWSVEDPSLSHATDSSVRNALGFYGAVISDLTIQLIGVASIVFILPLVFWGWSFLTGQPKVFTIHRILFWILGTFCAAAATSTLPVPDTWPLPSKLGGVIGSGLVTFSDALTASLTVGQQTIIGLFGFGIPAIILFALSVGLVGKLFSWRRNSKIVQQEADSANTPFQDELGFGIEDEKEYPFSAYAGAVAHWYYMAKGFLVRIFIPSALRKKRPDPEKITVIAKLLQKFRSKQDGDGLEEFYQDAPTTTSEVQFDINNNQFDSNESIDLAENGEFANGDGQTNEFSNPDQVDSDQNITGKLGVTPTKVGFFNRAKKNRVVPPNQPPKPSERAINEAQPSFFPTTKEYELPPLHLLSEPEVPAKDSKLSQDALELNARNLEGVLDDFSIRGEILKVRPGPVVTLYELEPAPGIKSSRVIGLSEDIARSMSANSARVAVIPGKNAIGIELPNQNRETVYFRELVGSKDFEKSKAKLAMALGKKINGETVIADLARMPHLLVAGTTGSGKSVSINTMILSFLYRLSPEEVKLIMIDPKMLELSIYEGIPHLLTPVVTDPKKAVVALKWTVREMEERYRKMSKVGVRNIDGFNSRVKQAQKKGENITRTVQTGFDQDTGQAIYEKEHLELSPLPYIVVVVDEMADLMMVAGKEIEGAIQRLAQMARAAGIHIIMATQRPSVDVITGTIKANFPTRISFQVTTKIDSRTILGEQGAEQLLGMGDMLYMAGGGRIQRVHAPFVTDDEIATIVEHLKSQGTPKYLEQITQDAEDSAKEESLEGNDSDSDGGDMYEEAVAIVLRDRKASTSYLQRRLSIGYNRAATLIERMEDENIVSPAGNAGKREILIPEGETI